MKHLKTYEKINWSNYNKDINNYIVWTNHLSNRFTILKVIKKYTEKGVDKIELERIHLFDLDTGEDINEPHENWIYTSKFTSEHIQYQSDNLQDLLNIKNMIIQKNKYNL